MESGSDHSLLDRARTAAFAVGMFVFLLYVPTFWNGFIPDYDDNQYVTDNAIVLGGLTWEGVVWAFTTDHFANWLPITWLSHMLDVSLFGKNAGGHHATSALLHALNAGLLLWFFARASGRFMVSVVAAVVFAVHPLRVESVAWVAERKDVLAGTFFLLALIAYLRYVERPSWWRFSLVAICHALGLMSKTMVVTLPAVLLLLDWWPLRRVAPFTNIRRAIRQWRPLVVEKLPLLLLSAIAATWTILLQRSGKALEYGEQFSLVQRLGNAIVAIPRYFYLQAVPADLAVFYPHPGDWAAWKILASASFIITVCLIVWHTRRSAPWLLLGWIWFLVMLAPVSGVIQAGMQSIADRYTYLPGIGLTFAAACTGAALWRRLSWSRSWGVEVTVAVVAVLSAMTLIQQRYWKDSLTLFTHADAVTRENWVARIQIGVQLAMSDDDAAAIEWFRQAQAAHPRLPNAPYNIGQVRRKQGRLEEAEAEFRLALSMDPNHAQSRYTLGVTLLLLGDDVEALAHLHRAVQLQPEWEVAQDGLVEALEANGGLNDAARFFGADSTGLTSSFDPWFRAGSALLRGGHQDNAARHLAEAVRLDPASVEARLELSSALILMERPEEAVIQLAEAVRLRPKDVNARVSWAGALAATGEFDEAERQVSQALRQDPESEFAQRTLRDVQKGKESRRSIPQDDSY